MLPMESFWLVSAPFSSKSRTVHEQTQQLPGMHKASSETGLLINACMHVMHPV